MGYFKIGYEKELQDTTTLASQIEQEGWVDSDSGPGRRLFFSIYKKLYNYEYIFKGFI